MIRYSLHIVGTTIATITNNVIIGMDKIFEVKSTTGQIMNVYEDIETYTDFFNYVAWLSLQYGYSGRYALRFSDYAGI